ncbi:MAG: ABC transporter ATP-binding protein [Caldisphaeraceae archaeon]|nr:ABC transporter ATP-binding protein [Caldisphaeraceae archaeon]MEB3691808.1 ABC transporter ATP-binding protein [Caldisphaeraceae archaeon]MEB3797540.1 ABC transporter ATP-binding protein [Caldisphaeraceae archaeon]
MRIVVENLIKKYKYFTLTIPRLCFTQGINLVIGSNGSGKSTLLKAIAGFIRPDRGKIVYEVDGKNLYAPLFLDRIGYIGEDIILPNIKVKDILESFIDKDRLEYAISSLQLREYLNKKYLDLSAGFRKRVQVAIALGKDSEILLLDEPFTNIDAMMIKPLKDALERLKNKIIILTSHLIFEINATTLTLLDQGRPVYHGSPPYRDKHFIVEVGKGERVRLNVDLLNELIQPLRVVEQVSIDSIIEDLSKQKNKGNVQPPQEC